MGKTKTKMRMKRATSLLTAILLMLSFFTFTSAAPIGMVAGFPWDFEDGSTHGVISNAEKPPFPEISPLLGAGCNVALVNDFSRGSGSNSIHVTGRTAHHSGPMFDLTPYVEVGVKYRITAWIYSQHTASTNFRIRINTGITGLGERVQDAVTVNTARNTWTRLSSEYRFATNEYSAFYIDTPNTSGTSNHPSFYVDDISLEVVDDSTFNYNPSLAPLKDAYKDFFLLGSVFTVAEAKGLRMESLKRHFDAVTFENWMKPVYLSQVANTYTLAPSDALLAYAEGTGLKTVGHTLVWHSQSAPWLNPSGTTRAQAMANLEAYIQTVAGHYSGKLISWDVVNEIMGTGAPNGNWKNSVTSTPWRTAFANGADASKGEDGTDFIYYAFVFARKYDPYAKLYYNDFSMNNANKVDAVCLMVNALNARYAAEHPEDPRKLIEGVGMQDHDTVTTSVASHESAIQKLIAAGVDISVTELDIQISGSPGAAAFATQANVYAQYFHLFKKYAANIDRVTLWGMDDGNGWRVTGYPMLFNEDFSAKPAYYAVLDPEGYLGLEPMLPPAADIKLTTAAHLVKAGDYFTLDTAFTKKQNSNAAILNYTFDGSKFEFAGFTAAAGVQVLNTDHGDGYAKLTLGSMDYDLENFGSIMLRAKEDAALANEFQTVAVAAEYVQKLADGTKIIRSASTTARFTTLGGSGGGPALPGDTNWDGVLDLIDLSNMIDWFGFSTSSPDWLTLYIFFDFNNNGAIDISDIAYVAQRI